MSTFLISSQHSSPSSEEEISEEDDMLLRLITGLALRVPDNNQGQRYNENEVGLGRLPLTNPNRRQQCVPFHGRERDPVPSHYLLRIESFASLSKASIECYRSEFETGGYKWELSIYPCGDKQNGGQDHISVFLRLLETNSLPVGWEVNAIFTFFLFDQIRDKYVTPQADSRVVRFHSMKTNCGVPKFIDLATFNNPSNGYLINGNCSFGAEVFVVKNSFKGECLSVIDKPVTCTHAWKLDAFSAMKLNRYESDLFVGGDYKWRIVMYPSGIFEGEGNSLAVFLQLDVSTLALNTKLFVNICFRLKNQMTSDIHFEQKANYVISSSTGWGFRQFMSLSKFKHPPNGFLVADSCIIEVQFQVIGLIRQDL